MATLVDHFDAARRLGIDPDVVREWIKRGLLKGRAGSEPERWNVDEDELSAVIAERTSK